MNVYHVAHVWKGQRFQSFAADDKHSIAVLKQNEHAALSIKLN